MFKLLIIAAVVAIGLADSTPNDLHPLNPFSPNGRIVGGTPATIQEVPHQVSLQNYGVGFCGGSIISAEWILTAAHCVVYSINDIMIRAGTHTRSAGGSSHKVKEMIQHENFKTNSHGILINDIALIRLAKPLELDETRKPVPLFNEKEEVAVGSAAFITGWGATREGGHNTEVLQKVTVPVISKSNCDAAYKHMGGLPAGQICAAYAKGGKDACQGDSGGPLTVNGRLAGITSWGNGCARPRYPGVYTEIAAFRGWIKEKTGL